MSVAKVVEISAQSKESFDDAIKRGIGRASETLKNVQSAWVKDQQIEVQDGAPSSYRVTLKITFRLS